MLRRDFLRAAGATASVGLWIFSPLLCQLSYPAAMAPIVWRRGVFTMQ